MNKKEGVYQYAAAAVELDSFMGKQQLEESNSVIVVKWYTVVVTLVWMPVTE